MIPTRQIILTFLLSLICSRTESYDESDCILFKYTFDLDRVNTTGGFYADYTQWVVESGNENIFYQSIQVWTAKKGEIKCKPMNSSYCMVKHVPRKTPMNKFCYRNRGEYTLKLHVD